MPKRDPIEVGRELARKTLAGMRTSLRERFAPHAKARPDVRRMVRAGAPMAELDRQIAAYGEERVLKSLEEQ